MQESLTYLPVETADLAGSAWNIYVVGAGGTGSWVVNGLARLMGVMEQERRLAASRISSITVIDFDDVKPHNVGRQLFSPSEVGMKKAEVLTGRYNRAFGLDFRFVLKNLNQKNFWDVIPEGSLKEPTLILGAVDNNKARLAIHKKLKAFDKKRRRRRAIVWLDAGNGKDFGQVIWGNTFSSDIVEGGVTKATAEFAPFPTVVFPELLDLSMDKKGVACDAPLLANEQGFNINSIMANLILEMLVNMLEGQLVHHFAYVNLKEMEMTSQPLTRAWLMDSVKEGSIVTRK